MLRVILLITEYRNFSAQPYLFKTFLDLIYWFDRVFWKPRQRISIRTHAFSILMKWKRYLLLQVSLIVNTWKKSDHSSKRLCAFKVSSEKCLVKLTKGFWDFLTYEHRKKPYRNTLKSRHWNLLVLFLPCPTFVLCRLKKFLYFHFYLRAGWNLSLINLIKR